MSTQSWSSVLQHSSDATFRTWGSDFAAKLAAVGMVQTSDTGRINWASVTRPGTNTAAGYEIWRFNDSLQGSAPIFFKIEYGTGGVATYPMLWLTVGTGSNGSGTITGTASTRATCGYTGATGSVYDTASAWPSYFCAVTGFLGCMFRVGAATGTNCTPCFIIARHADANGTPNGNGFTVYHSPNISRSTGFCRVQSVRTASTAATFAADTTGQFCLIPHGITGSTTNSGDLQVFSHWTPTNQVTQVFALASHISSELSQGTPATITVMSSARTFISVGPVMGGPVGNGTGTGMVMLWE